MEDSRQAYNFGRGARKTLSADILYFKLAEELVDNDFDDHGIYWHHMSYYNYITVLDTFDIQQLQGPHL